MGLLQSVASLAQPTNTVRPSDILMVGQQAQSNLKEGLGGIAGMMASERKQTAQERADSAVAGLLSNAPKGTQDPTQFNQMLGMASTYGSQQMKDTAKNAIESAREGYRNAVQQEQFGQQIKLQRDQFDETVKNNENMFNLKTAELSQAFAVHEDNIKANRENALLQAKTQKDVAQIHANSSAALLGLEKQKFKASQDLIEETKKANGYVKGKDGKWTFNPTTPEYGASANAAFMNKLNSSKVSYKSFMDNYETSQFWGGYLTSNKEVMDVYSRTMKLLGTNTTDPQFVAVKNQLLPLVEAGDLDSLKVALSKLTPTK